MVDTNRNNSTAMTTTTDDAKNIAVSASTAVGQSIKSSKSFESGVLGQHANTPNGVIPWPGDRGKPRPPSHQWDHHNGTPLSPHHNIHHQQQQHHQQQHNHQQKQQSGSSPYNGGSEVLYLGNRSSGIRTSSRGGPTYFSPQHNHVSVNCTRLIRINFSLWLILILLTSKISKFRNKLIFRSSTQPSIICKMVLAYLSRFFFFFWWNFKFVWILIFN